MRIDDKQNEHDSQQLSIICYIMCQDISELPKLFSATFPCSLYCFVVNNCVYNVLDSNFVSVVNIYQSISP